MANMPGKEAVAARPPLIPRQSFLKEWNRLGMLLRTIVGHRQLMLVHQPIRVIGGDLESVHGGECCFELLNAFRHAPAFCEGYSQEQGGAGAVEIIRPECPAGVFLEPLKIGNRCTWTLRKQQGHPQKLTGGERVWMGW